MTDKGTDRGTVPDHRRCSGEFGSTCFMSYQRDYPCIYSVAGLCENPAHPVNKSDHAKKKELSKAFSASLMQKAAEDAGLRGPLTQLLCNRCGRIVSTKVPKDTIVQAWIECPDCIESEGTKAETKPELGRFEETALLIGRLVDRKNRAYGSAFQKTGQVLRVIYPGGIRPEQMDDALAIVRVLDKMFRIATHRDALAENPWEDIAGYGILMSGSEQEKGGKAE